MTFPVMLVRARVRKPRAGYDERLDGADIIEDGEDIVAEQYFVVPAPNKQTAEDAVEQRCENRGWDVEAFLSFEQRVDDA